MAASIAGALLQFFPFQYYTAARRRLKMFMLSMDVQTNRATFANSTEAGR